MKTNASGRMQLKDETSDYFFLLLNQNAAATLKEDIMTATAPGVFKAEVALNIESANEAVDSENVVAVIKGSEKPDEYVVVSSHLDHIGITADGQINNGADDDGSGTVAMLEMAEAFKEAQEKGDGPKRSIVPIQIGELDRDQ